MTVKKHRTLKKSPWKMNAQEAAAVDIVLNAIQDPFVDSKAVSCLDCKLWMILT